MVKLAGVVGEIAESVQQKDDEPKTWQRGEKRTRVEMEPAGEPRHSPKKQKRAGGLNNSDHWSSSLADDSSSDESSSSADDESSSFSEESEEEENEDEAPQGGMVVWTKPQQVAKAKRLARQVQEIATSLHQISFMRHSLAQLLSSITMEGKRWREVHRLLLGLSKNTLYVRVTAERWEGLWAHYVEAEIYSLTTGLTWSCNDAEATEELTAFCGETGTPFPALEGGHGGEPEEEVEQVMEFLFGPARALVVPPRELARFFTAILTPRKCPTELELGW